MKKVLLAGTALVGLALASAPANAEVKLGLGGLFRGYGVHADSDIADRREADLRRDSEVHVSGETTLDNGLTVGFHTEQDLGASSTSTDEVYSYFSGGWGRINLGSEDGAAYLLQVAAPSADSNVDGLRTYIQGIEAADSVFTSNSTFGLRANSTPVLAYDQVSDPTGATNTDRLTYITPKFNGFQAGVSYAPETGQNAVGNNVASMAGDAGTSDFEDIWEVAARYDGEFSGFGFSVGAGYSDADTEALPAALTPGVGTESSSPLRSDGLAQWNLGASVAFSGFTVGGAFVRQDSEMTDIVDPGNSGTTWVRKSLDVTQDSWVAGVAYDNGPYHVGFSYLDQSLERDASGVAADDGELAALDADVQRYTVGGGYTFGPGMTFRGAVAWGDFDNSTGASDAGQTGNFLGANATNNDFSQVTIGTDIQF